MLFWIIAALLTLLTLGLILPPLLWPGQDDGGADASDMDIYRDQLRELERDIERGVIGGDEAERARTEIARRLLAADKAGPRKATTAPAALTRGAAVVAAAAVLGLTGWLYWTNGSPGAEDMPRVARLAEADALRRDRPGQLELEAEVTEFFSAPIQISADEAGLVEELRRVVPENPDDLRGWQLLAVFEARMQDYAAAASAQARVIEMKGDEATDEDRFSLAVNLFIAANGAVSPDLAAILTDLAPGREDQVALYQALARQARSVGHFIAATRAQERALAALGEDRRTEDLVRLLDYMVAAIDGSVSPEAETIAARVLREDPDNIAAMFYMGKLYADIGRYDQAFRAWRRVVEEGDPDTFHTAYARQVIGDVAWMAGAEYDVPQAAAPTRGPTAEDMAAAAEMSEEDRVAFIEGMVANLSDRLATEGGAAPDWAQLINALGVLGRTDEARAIYDEALGVFAADPAALDMLRTAAQSAGVAE
ncbi:MAG: cytochrome c-type biogenesis protein CcmH [Rhodobacteraceae bacterium HLUCCA08]|nr:MAG: cytochrome c-type biogenesis protein CcmH [Rhodobacteraceae bacterium HLUCCA08]